MAPGRYTAEGHPVATLELPIVGMTCASCSTRLERALGTLEGVEAVSVQLVTEQARLSIRDRDTALRVVQGVRDAGFEVAAQSVQLDVSGMTCASCSGAAASYNFECRISSVEELCSSTPCLCW